MGQEEIRRSVGAERELENTHPRVAEALPEHLNRGGDEAEVLGHDGKRAEGSGDRGKQFGAGPSIHRPLAAVRSVAGTSQ